jgi:thymidylate kinase
LSRRILIILTGVDGVGKSTQTALLHEKLRDKFNIAVIHDDFPQLVMRVIQGLNQRYKKKNNITLNEPAKETYSSLRSLLHIFLYAFNEIIILMCILNGLKENDTIILDRWFPDSLASVTYHKIIYMPLVKNILLVLGKTTGFIIKLLNIIAFVVLLKVDPSVAHMRRPEHSFLRQKIVSNLIDYFVGITAKKNYWPLLIIDTTNMSVLKAHASILKALRKTLEHMREEVA